jgi:hypothetical protein
VSEAVTPALVRRAAAWLARQYDAQAARDAQRAADKRTDALTRRRRIAAQPRDPLGRWRPAR